MQAKLEMDADMDEIESEEFGPSSPPPSIIIKGILERYPDGQIFKVHNLCDRDPYYECTCSNQLESVVMHAVYTRELFCIHSEQNTQLHMPCKACDSILINHMCT